MGVLSGVGYRHYWVIDDSNRAEADMLIRRITSQKRTAAPVKTPSISLRLSGRSNSKREISFSWR